MGSFLSQLFTGLSIGATLLLIALGLTFTFGQMNVINMAHGEFIMAGAYAAFLLQGVFPRGTSLLVALPVAFVVAGTMGLVLEVTLIRRLYGRPLDTLLVTWGVSLMLQQLARDVFGAPNVQVLSPRWLEGGVHLAGVVDMPYARLFIMALVAAAVAGIWVYLNHLPQGRRMQAVMQNRELAACSGIPTASGSSQLTAIPPCVPSWVNGALNIADGEAYLRSQASARQSPAPMQGPFTAATTGTGICCGASQAR